MKWRETRVMYGKEATGVMWITDAIENDSYSTRAESHGAIYKTHFKISTSKSGSRLTMTFEGQAMTVMAKLMNLVFGRLMLKSINNALMEDLVDIKTATEKI